MKSVRYQQTYKPDSPDYRLLRMATESPLEQSMAQIERMAEATGAMAGGLAGEQDVLAGEKPELLLPISSAAVAYNRAAEEAYKVQVEHSIRSKVAELGTQFDGRRPSDPDSFAQMFDASAGEIVQAVPESMRGRVAAEVTMRRQAAVGEIAEKAKRHAFERSVSEVQAGLKADLDEASVYARDGNFDMMSTVEARAAERIGLMVRDGVWSEEEGNIHLRDLQGDLKAERIFGESVRGGNLVGAYNEALNGGPRVEGLTASQRDRLITRLSGEIGRRESAAAHARAANEAAVRRNSDLADTVTSYLEAGMQPPGELAQVHEALQSGRMQISESARDKYNRARGTFMYTAQLTEMPPAAAEAQANAVFAAAANGQGVPPAVAESVMRAAERHRSGLGGDDPVGYLSKAGLLRDPLPGPLPEGANPADVVGPRVPAPPIRFDSPDALRATLLDRRRRIEDAEIKYQRDLPALTKAEITEMRLLLDKQPAAVRVAYLEALGATLGDKRAELTMKMLGESGAGNYATIGVLAAKGRRDDAMLVAQGDFIGKSDRERLLKPIVAGQGYEADFDKEVGNLWSYSRKKRDSLRETAVAHYVASQPPGAVYDSEKFRESVRKLTQGTTTLASGSFWSGAKSTVTVARDKGGNEINLQSRLERLTGKDIEEMGGVNVKGSSDRVAQIIRDNALHFEEKAPGKYEVLVEIDGMPVWLGRPGLDPSKRFILDLTKGAR